MNTEREKQIQAVMAAKNMLAYGLSPYDAGNIVDALAPWLKEPEHTERFHAEVSDHGKRLMMLEDFARKTDDLINSPFNGILKRLQGLEPLPKPEAPAPTPDLYSVSIMRAKGSKWHTVVNDIDWVEAVEVADRWYGDPEIQQVQVRNEGRVDEEIVYMKRKP